ncbi:MAG: MSCRAMM family adhesin SdrC [Gemmataceae bacterium]|nr:MSCRAMM family adhesin SdrC [Gemmataceae bacterium]
MLEALEDRWLLASLLWIGPENGVWSNKDHWCDRVTGAAVVSGPVAGDSVTVNPNLVAGAKRGTDTASKQDIGGFLPLQNLTVDSSFTKTIKLVTELQVNGIASLAGGTIKSDKPPGGAAAHLKLYAAAGNTVGNTTFDGTPVTVGLFNGNPALLDILNDISFINAASLNVLGRVNWKNGNYGLGNGALALIVANGGVFDIQCDKTMTGIVPALGNPQVVVNGTFSKSAGIGLATIKDTTFRLGGLAGATPQFNLLSGTVKFQGSAVQLRGGTTTLNSGTLASDLAISLARGVLLGTGTVDAHLMNLGGTVRPGLPGAAGRLTVAAYTQRAAGTLSILVTGNGPNDIGYLNVAGQVNLDGALAVTRNFTPNNQVKTFMQWASRNPLSRNFNAISINDNKWAFNGDDLKWVPINGAAVNGTYTLSAVLWKPAVIGVGFNDANLDGRRQAGEGMLAGLAVRLLDAQDNILATTTTADDGSYSFDVNPGTYRVQVVPPSGYGAFTVQNAGPDPAIDSDVDSFGRTGLFTVSGTDVSLDAGLLPPVGTGTVTGRVWDDADANGLEGTGEAGLAGVLVDLIDNSTGQVVATVPTNRNGEYVFYGVMPGTYYLRFRPVDFADLFRFTGKDQGSDDAIDSDAGSTGLTDLVFSLPGGWKSDMDAGLLFQWV